MSDTLMATVGFQLDKTYSGYGCVPKDGPRIFPKIGPWSHARLGDTSDQC